MDYQCSRRKFMSFIGNSTLAIAATPSTLIIPLKISETNKWGRIIKKKPLLKSGAKKLKLYNIHTGETFNRIFWEQGHLDTQIMKEINHFFRDHRTNMVHPIDCSLLEILYQLSQKLKSNEAFHLCSGYRSEKSNALLRKKSHGVSANSLHKKGQAADIFIPNVPSKTLGRAALSLAAGGVGCYSDFVHVDSGRVRRWGQAV